jgi:anti-sigma-K factor RskA
VLVTALAPFPMSTDRALELWLVPVDGVPRSLGLIAASQSTSIVMPSALRPHAGTAPALAVSLEPPGGAPGGQATGPLVAQGELSRS